jgi:hypothetical protein
MAPSGYSTPQEPINGRPLGSFEDGHFIPHRDLATNERTSSTATSRDRSTSRERPATPEWYYDPDGLDHLNPVGVRNGASYPALEIAGSNFSSARDSVGGGYYKSGPHKRRRPSPTEYIKEGVRRLWPTPVHTPSLHSLSMSYGFTQSETALNVNHHPLMIEPDGDMSFAEYWALTGFAPTRKPERPVRPRTVSSPPVVACNGSNSVRWWEPSPYKARVSTSRLADGMEPELEEGNMSEPVSPVTQVPASPKIEGESKEDDLDMQMEALTI